MEKQGIFKVSKLNVFVFILIGLLSECACSANSSSNNDDKNEAIQLNEGENNSTVKQKNPLSGLSRKEWEFKELPNSARDASGGYVYDLYGATLHFDGEVKVVLKSIPGITFGESLKARDDYGEGYSTIIPIFFSDKDDRAELLFLSVNKSYSIPQVKRPDLIRDNPNLSKPYEPYNIDYGNGKIGNQFIDHNGYYVREDYYRGLVLLSNTFPAEERDIVDSIMNNIEIIKEKPKDGLDSITTDEYWRYRKENTLFNEYYLKRLFTIQSLVGKKRQPEIDNEYVYELPAGIDKRRRRLIIKSLPGVSCYEMITSTGNKLCTAVIPMGIKDNDDSDAYNTAYLEVYDPEIWSERAKRKNESSKSNNDRVIKKDHKKRVYVIEDYSKGIALVYDNFSFHTNVRIFEELIDSIQIEEVKDE